MKALYARFVLFLIQPALAVAAEKEKARIAAQVRESNLDQLEVKLFGLTPLGEIRKKQRWTRTPQQQAERDEQLQADIALVTERRALRLAKEADALAVSAMAAGPLSSP